MLNLFIYFLTGGVVTTLIVSLEQSGYRFLSGFVAIMPIFTLIAYFFIGLGQNGVALSQNGKLVLVGTLVAWVPYMLAVIFLAPHMSPSKAIGLGFLVFALCVTPYLILVQHFGWFQ
jgi:uncharacterized membrane protein (GlpM family)